MIAAQKSESPAATGLFAEENTDRQIIVPNPVSAQAENRQARRCIEP
jgi:hypothetical protein